MSENFEMTFNFTNYSVIVTRHTLVYVFDNGKTNYLLTARFENSIDPPSEGGKIQIAFKDQWGSEMKFIHYLPSDLKGMFDFIGRGYQLTEFIK